MPRDGSATKDRILDAAEALFAKRGFDGVTVRQIMSGANADVALAYYHFKSKRDLFIAVIDRTGDLTIKLWDHHLKNAKDPAQRLKRLIGANPMVTDRGQGIYRVIVQAMMEIKDDQILAALQRHVTAIHEFVTAEVERAQELGQVSKAYSPEVTAWTLLHLGLGYGILGPLGIEGHARDSKGVRVRQVIEQMMLGERARQVQDQRARQQAEEDAAGG